MYVTKPYYPLGKIQTGKYTSGNEFVLDTADQEEYIGLYHLLPNGDYWTESIPSDNSKKLTKKRFDFSNDVKSYNKINGVTQSNYTSPISYIPIITSRDYSTGYILRYFVQKRNNPGRTIQEINSEQYNTLNMQNRPGLNMITWNYIELKWTITTEFAKMLNLQELQRAEQNGFVNLSKYLMNPLEFWK